MLGFFTVDTAGATVQFGIDQQQYFLDASAANYNALFAMLLACWLEQRSRLSSDTVAAVTAALMAVFAPPVPWNPIPAAALEFVTALMVEEKRRTWLAPVLRMMMAHP